MKSFSTLAFFLVDVIFFRIPMTGLLTSTICKISLGFYITAPYVMGMYLTYASIYSSIVVSVLRMMAVVKPMDTGKLHIHLSRVLIPAIYLLPIVTVWFLVPAQAFYTPLDYSASLAVDYKKVFPNVRLFYP
ncbi:hypothetical protein OESDEN_23430 [Oesophagostomum dentatum]|uniref:Uncharacterized protein n=1 Tax=Oesophagostomum dentatum TaxID=61180 RepID=A0A0B1S137_OESDE|nr:hypothetical protein OESDEN_23430 [Oesophagostomum dentatum]